MRCRFAYNSTVENSRGSANFLHTYTVDKVRSKTKFQQNRQRHWNFIFKVKDSNLKLRT